MSILPTQQFDPASISSFGGFQTPWSGAGMSPTGSGLGGITPAGGGFSSLFGGTGLGANMPTFNLALGGLQTLGGLWGAINAAKMAKRQFAFTKDVTNTNLANQTQSYNTGISDRARSRGVTEGQSQTQVDDYIARNSLPTRKIG